MRDQQKIVSFGCSYTAGSEMLDHEVYRRADKIKRKKGYHYWYNNHRLVDGELHNRLRAREQQMSWPAIMARRLGWVCDNRAIGGSSLSHAVIQLEHALEQGIIDDHTWVFVGLTIPERSLRFQPDNAIKSWQLSLRSSWPDQHWHDRTVLDLYDDHYIWWLYTQDMLRMADLARTRFGSRLRMFNMFSHEFTLDKIRTNHVIMRRLRELELSGMWMNHISQDLWSLGLKGTELRYGGGHPRVEVHERWVEEAMPAVIESMG